MARPTTPTLTERFLGFNDQAPTEIGEFQASRFENFYIANEAQEIVRRNGTAPVIDSLGSTDFDMLRWVRLGGNNYLLAVHNGHVLNLLGSSPYFLPGGINRFTVGQDANLAFFANMVVIGNGVDRNVRFNGTDVRTLMPGKAASGTTLAAFGTGTITGTYSYRIAFRSSDLEQAEPSVATSGVTVTAVSGIVLSNIPVAAAADDSTGRLIYRTLNGGTTYYLVATIGDNSTTTYTDTTADADVDTSLTLDTAVVRTPPLQYLVAHQSRLAGIGGNTSEGNNRTLYVSNFENYGSCPLIAPLDSVDDPVNGIQIPLPDVGTGVIPLGNVLITSTRGQSWRLIGDNPNNYSFDKWNDHGCVSHRTFRVHKTLLLWLGPDGVYAVEGGGGMVSVRRVSDDITTSLAAISAADQAKAHAFVWNDRYYVCFPEVAFYYDLKYRVWGKLTNWLWRDSTVTQNTGAAMERIYAAEYGDAQVWELETGNTDDGTLITATWASRDKDLGQFARDKRIHRVVVAFKASTGSATVKLYRGAGEHIQTFTHDLSSVRRGGSVVSILDKRAVMAARDEFFRLEVSASVSSELRVLRAGAHFTLVT